MAANPPVDAAFRDEQGPEVGRGMGNTPAYAGRWSLVHYNRRIRGVDSFLAGGEKPFQDDKLSNNEIGLWGVAWVALSAEL
jgi:hypothetical protein